MAYIPDIAFTDIEQVGHKAFQLYAFYCKHGSMSNNRVCVSLHKAAQFLGVVYENACRLNATLKKQGWILHEKGDVVLCKGWIENDLSKFTKTDKNNSFDNKKLTKTTVKTDENNSFPSSSKTKTDENNSRKLTKTTVTYKEEPASFNQQEEKDISYEISKKKRAAIIPENFQVTESMAEWAKTQTPTVNVVFETLNFVDHFRNKGSTGLDWVAKWRTWMRNSFTDFGRYPEGKPTNQEKIANLGKNNGQTKQSFTDAREKASDRIKQTNARIDAMRELADRIESQNSVSSGNGRNREGNDFVVEPIAVIAGTVDGNGEGLGEAPF
jgi:hypothetical protein